jgi:hypothetical protein
MLTAAVVALKDGPDQVKPAPLVEFAEANKLRVGFVQVIVYPLLLEVDNV